MISKHFKLLTLTQPTSATAICASPQLHVGFFNDGRLQVWSNNYTLTRKTFEEVLPEHSNRSFGGLLKNLSLKN